jgi:hypothetical protein
LPARATDGWHYAVKGGAKFGPVPAARIQGMLERAELDLNDLVWHQGMPKWRPIRAAPDLLIGCVVPPPLPGESKDVALHAGKRPEVDYGPFLLALPVIATGLMYYWVGGMSLLESPGSHLAFIAAASIFGTAVLAALEATKVGMKTDKSKGTYDGTSWFFVIVLFWIIGYPAYLYKRKQYGLKDLLGLGALVTVLFTLMLLYTHYSIEDAKDRVRSNLEKIQDQFGQ